MNAKHAALFLLFCSFSAMAQDGPSGENRNTAVEITVAGPRLPWNPCKDAPEKPEGTRKLRELCQAPEAISWNRSRTINACETPNRDNAVCDCAVNTGEYQQHAGWIPRGCREVFFTRGCPDCPVGWVLVDGDHCQPGDFNCSE